METEFKTQTCQVFKRGVIIIGAGAAGLMCAAIAAARGRKVLVLDHANKVGKKILMSGGGRCNFTNLYTDAIHFISQNSHFCKSALSRYTPYDFLDLVDRYDLEYFEKTQGQYFCQHKAKDLLSILLEECSIHDVDIRTHCNILDVKKHSEPEADEVFYLNTSLGRFACQSLVVATGGLSIPTMGASGFGYELAKKFGHDIVKTDAALVPFTLTDQWSDKITRLAGISIEVEVECNEYFFADALLFTHRGLSGPAILQISNYWQLGDEVSINFLPSCSLQSLIDNAIDCGDNSLVKNLLTRVLPKRFVFDFLSNYDEIINKKARQLDTSELTLLSSVIHRWVCIPAGTEGYRTAEVTRGGVSTEQVSSKTFESKKVNNLFFIGEVLDVTGWLGGFNFQWAWSSAWCAGQHV